MNLLARPANVTLAALGDPRHYAALWNSFAVYGWSAPVWMWRYVNKSGDYPATIRLNTPTGRIQARLHCMDDLLTVNEIFCRGDYRIDRPNVVVDLGSNIGISALYFLSRDPDCFCYLYEPLEENAAKLRENLAPFEGRYQLETVAVALADGTVSFGYEPTGRYGGVNVPTGAYRTVPAREINAILAGVLARHGEIDLLKMDIESLERELLMAIRPDVRRRIRRLFVEMKGDRDLLADDFNFHQYGSVARFLRADSYSTA